MPIPKMAIAENLLSDAKAPSADAIDFNEGVGVTITRSGGGAITNLDKDTLWHCIYLGGNAWIIK